MSSIGGLLYTKNTVNTLEITAMSKAISNKHSDRNEIWKCN